MKNKIVIKGAKVNNLKNVSLEIPLNQITCFIGPSGSGKSSLAFQTLYTESKRRFLNSFPTYLKFFSDRPPPVDVDEIFPVLPVFGLPQINPVVGTRSNVADIMHLTELLQAHYFHFSKELCPKHKVEFKEHTFREELEEILDINEVGKCYGFLNKEDFLEYFSKQPFPSRSLKSTRSKKVSEFNEEDKLWEVLRFKTDKMNTVNKAIDPYLKKNLEIFIFEEAKNKLHKINFKVSESKCSVVGCMNKAKTDNNILRFSPYNALGACSECNGFGETLAYDENKLVDREKSINDDGVLLLNYKRYTNQKLVFKKLMKREKISLEKKIKELPEKFWEILYQGKGSYYGFDYYFSYLERKKYKMNVRIFIRNIQKNEQCKSCHGSRLTDYVNQFFIEDKYFKNLNSIFSLTILDLLNFLKENQSVLFVSSREANKSYKKILGILEVAVAIGLGHLKITRKAKSLSAGEYQRLLLLKYLSYDGTGAMFIFDEPSIGLSKLELTSLFSAFQMLINRGNTVVLVEHNETLIKKSDFIIELGPGAGVKGGELIFSGEKKKYNFPTLKTSISSVQPKSKNYIELLRPEIYEKKFPSVKILREGINLVKGSSGTGKSAVIVNTFAAHLHYKLNGEHLNIPRGDFFGIKGKLDFEDVIIVDTQLNKYTSRSTVGSLTGLFPVLRKYYADLAVSKSMGLVDGNFSFNSANGYCPTCEGKGSIIVEMQFLEDIKLECEDCEGKKLKPIYADITDGRFTVHEAFNEPIHNVFENVKLTPKFQKVLKYLEILNLDYLSLSRQINSLSGGERQRIYLLSKLQKSLKNALIIFENISFGLSRKELLDQAKLLLELQKNGNTIILIDQDPILEKIAGHRINFN